jgi:exodeoxyribonuclease VII small subunit
MSRKNTSAHSCPTADKLVTPAADAQIDPALPASYELAVQELEALVAHIEAGQLPLDQLLTGYRRGAQLLAFCRSQLDAVEQQIRVLDGGDLLPWSSQRDEQS